MTDPGGTISVLDPGGFGALTITKPVTIDAAGEFAGVLVSGTNGIVVNAPGDQVTLRGLTIEYVAPCSAPSTSLDGILLEAGSLSVQDVSIHGFPEDGVDARATSNGSSLDVSGSDVRDNCGGGVAASTTAGHVSATLSDNFLSDDGVAVFAGPSSSVTISENTIADNAVGLASSSGGTLSSLADNRITGNTSAGVAPVELVSPFAPPAPVVAPTPAPTTTTAVAPLPPTCRVPNLTSLTLASARKALVRARCVLGTVSYRTVKHHRRGLVYIQQPRPGTLQLQGAITNVTLDGHPLPAKKPAKKPRAHRALSGGGATRTWVSGVGSDANPCSRTAPCATFAGALSKTLPGGTVDALDPGSFGPIVLNAATANTGTVTIQGNPGATIEVPSGATGVLVDSGPAANVILRDLTIISAPGCSGTGGANGINVLSGGNLHLEDVHVSGFPGSGLEVEPDGAMSITASNSTFYDDCTTGVSVQPSSGSVDLTTSGVRILNNPTGALAGAGAVIRLGATTVSGALTALSASGGGLIQGWPDNDLTGNASLGTAPGPLGFS